MKTAWTSWLSLPLTLALVLLAPAAHAESSLDACGNIWIEANASCEVEPPGIQCQSLCEPLRLELSCAQDLAFSCQGDCAVDVSAELPDCQTACETECVQDPPRFDCHTSCEARCDAGCSGHCSTAGGAHCEASCQASCALNCDTECRELPPSSTCTTICERSCTGSLKAELSVDCQVNCQAQGFDSCTLELTGGCQTACETEEGALFCDGQFIDHGDNLQTCIDALQNLDITVEFETEGKVSVGCNAGAGRPGAPWALLPLILAPLFLRRRR